MTKKPKALEQFRAQLDDKVHNDKKNTRSTISLLYEGR